MSKSVSSFPKHTHTPPGLLVERRLGVGRNQQAANDGQDLAERGRRRPVLLEPRHANRAVWPNVWMEYFAINKGSIYMFEKEGGILEEESQRRSGGVVGGKGQGNEECSMFIWGTY